MAFLLTPTQARSQDKSTPEKVRVAIATSSMAFLVPFVAKDRGFYLKYGSDVELIVMRPNIAMAALLGGDIDYAELIGSIIRSAARNLPVRAISTSIKAPFFSVIGQNKFKSIKDLKGAVIGLTSIGGTNHVSTRMTLNQFGLDIDKDVKILAIGDEKLMYDTFKIGPRRRHRRGAAFFRAAQAGRISDPGQYRRLRRIPFSGLGTTLDQNQNQPRADQKIAESGNRSAALHSRQSRRHDR